MEINGGPILCARGAKRRFICALILLAAGLAADAAHGAIVDEPLPASQARILNPEFSADGSLIVWLETEPVAPYGPGEYRYIVWLDAIDRSSGWPKSDAAQGVRVNDPELHARNIRSMPQWGRNDGTPHPLFDRPCPLWQGDFVVWIAAGPGRFGVTAGIARARVLRNPITSNLRLCPEGVVVLPEDRNAPNQKAITRFKRSFPFAAKNPGSPDQLISYQIRDNVANPPFGDFKVLAFNALEAAANLQHELVVDEDLDYPEGNRAAGIINFPSWLPGTSVLYLGVYSGCDPHVTFCPGQIARWDFTTGGVPEVVTNDDLSTINMIPLRHGGLPSLAAGVDNTKDGVHYVTSPIDPDELVLAGDILWDPAQTSLQGGPLLPFSAQSFEAFEWGDEAYVVYQVSEFSLPAGELPSPYAFFYQTEIWLARLPVGQSPVVCKISMDDLPGTPLVRHEPEPVVLDGRAYVYYSIGELGHRQLEDFDWHLRRIDLGEKSAFDAACESGDAAPPAA